MLYVDIPSQAEFAALRAVRADICVSIVLPTTPLTQHTDASRIELKNLIAEAEKQLAGADKRRVAALSEHLRDLVDDDLFWKHQANSLVVLATPDTLRTYRLGNKLTAALEVSDRFYLKPLLRALTLPQAARVLALSENDVRLVEVYSDLPAQVVKVADLPTDAASAVGKSTLNDRSSDGRLGGLEGQNVRFRQFLRSVNKALRPVLAGSDLPLILASTGRLEAMFREMNAYPHLLPESIMSSPDRLTPAELANAARPILDKAYEREMAAFGRLFETRRSDGRATSDISDAARAARFGAIDTLLVNIDTQVPGFVDDAGRVTFVERNDAKAHGVVDEIAGRAMAAGARVFGVRAADLPDGKDLAAVLRYAV